MQAGSRSSRRAEVHRKRHGTSARNRSTRWEASRVNGEREGEVREAGSRVPSPAVRLLAVAAAGNLYGSLSARVPGTSDPTAFWVGNLAAPYLPIPFLAGTWRFRAIGSAVAGAAAAVSAVAGFYRFLIVWHTTSTNLGLAADTPTRTVIARAYGYWFRNLA